MVCYHVPNVSWTEAWSMSPTERELVIEVLREDLERRAEAARGARSRGAGERQRMPLDPHAPT